MNDFTPNRKFEEKLKAAAAAPSADPEFVKRLRAQMIASGAANQPSQNQNQPVPLAEQFKAFCYNVAALFKGNSIMKTKLFAPALVAVIVLAIAGFFIFNPVNKVSAQQILDRAASVQSAALPTEGVWHTVIKIYENPLALMGDRPGTSTTNETYSSLNSGSNSTLPEAQSTNLYRTITTDASGKVIDVFATDGKFNYSNFSQNSDAVVGNDGALTIYRTPVIQESRKNVSYVDSSNSAKALFDDFSSNPRVELQGTITWIDGSKAYVLVNHNDQTQKSADGQIIKTAKGSTKMIFNADTYKLLESQTSIIKDGQEIVIEDFQFTSDEILPATTPVAWDLSDLKEVAFVDEAVAADTNYEPQSKVITEHELAALINAYVLKTIPEGYSLEIISTPNDPQNQSYNYEINYTNPEGESFGMMAVGTMDPGFIEKSFYDGSYITASGLVINYSSSSKEDSTSAMLTIPDGTSFLLTSSMSRVQTQQWVDDLVPAK